MAKRIREMVIDDEQRLISKIFFMSSEEFYDAIGCREIYEYQEIVFCIIEFRLDFFHSRKKIECFARRSRSEIVHFFALLFQ